MQRWKRLIAAGLVSSVALLGAACEAETTDDTTDTTDTTDTGTTETEPIAPTETGS